MLTSERLEDDSVEAVVAEYVVVVVFEIVAQAKFANISIKPAMIGIRKFLFILFSCLLFNAAPNELRIDAA